MIVNVYESRNLVVRDHYVCSVLLKVLNCAEWNTCRLCLISRGGLTTCQKRSYCADTKEEIEIMLFRLFVEREELSAKQR